MFKTMTSVLDPKKNPTEEEIAKIPSYIFCRWLSGSPHAIQAANQINYYDKIPIENQYRMIKSAFAGKLKYIPYPKNTSEKALKQVEYISEHFKLNHEMAREYISFMDPKELQEIVQMYQDFELKK